MIKTSVNLSIEIEIKNHKDIVAKEKGWIVGFLSKLSKNTDQKVEDAIKEKIESVLETKLKEELKKNILLELENNGVEAEVSIY